MKLKTILIFAIIAFLLVHIIGFIRFGELTFYWEYFEDNLTANSSIDPLIARIMSIVFGLIALLIAPYFFSLKFNKFFVFACCYGLWLIINTIMMIIYPDITDCKQCMALNPTTSEYEFFNCPRRKPDLHKKYGTKVYCAGYPNQRIIPNDNTIYFTNNGGEPILWYFMNDAGQYEIFNQRGNHPKFGAALKEITPETAKIIDSLRIYDPGMILGTNILPKSELMKIDASRRTADSLSSLSSSSVSAIPESSTPKTLTKKLVREEAFLDNLFGTGLIISITHASFKGKSALYEYQFEAEGNCDNPTQDNYDPNCDGGPYQIYMNRPKIIEYKKYKFKLTLDEIEDSSYNPDVTITLTKLY